MSELARQRQKLEEYLRWKRCREAMRALTETVKATALAFERIAAAAAAAAEEG